MALPDLTTLAPEEVKHLNLGGGPNFRGKNWLNLDSVSDGPGRLNFMFTPDCVFPVAAGTVHSVYSSHAFEHLNDETIWRLLRESKRALKPGGALIIKIPDFEQAIRSFLSNDEHFFRDELWNFGFVTPTWTRLGIASSLVNKAIMIFCSFATRQFGNPFEGATPEREGAYFGPPPLTEHQRNTLFKSSPAFIARQLRCMVAESYSDAALIHQNAWSAVEFEALLSMHGFDLISQDKTAICREISHIPDLEAMFEQSSYYLAVAS
jgi:hypothetical protein